MLKPSFSPFQDFLIKIEISLDSLIFFQNSSGFSYSVCHYFFLICRIPKLLCLRAFRRVYYIGFLVVAPAGWGKSQTHLVIQHDRFKEQTNSNVAVFMPMKKLVHFREFIGEGGSEIITEIFRVATSFLFNLLILLCPIQLT